MSTHLRHSNKASTPSEVVVIRRRDVFRCLSKLLFPTLIEGLHTRHEVSSEVVLECNTRHRDGSGLLPQLVQPVAYPSGRLFSQHGPR
jgi:hypothetical protein